MKSIQLVAILVVLGFMTFISVGVVWADPPADNPNIQTFTNVYCDDGTTFDAIVNPGLDETSCGWGRWLYTQIYT